MGASPSAFARQDVPQELRSRLSRLFDGMMRALFRQRGSQFSVDIVASPDAVAFISEHGATLDASFEQVPMSDAMRRRLSRSNFIFSGMKTFHELHEAFPSLVDENGARKPFERFLNDVRRIDKTYNANYLRAEYNFVAASADMAAKWERFSQDGDRYNLQYRTAGDGRVRPEHAALNGVTLPPSDSFWQEFYAPNGWNCRCNVVQVRKSKYPVTPHDEAMRRGNEALAKDTRGIFRFNSGIEQKTFPDYNPYTIRRCRDCDVAKGKVKLARFVPDNEVCAACLIIHRLRNEGEQRKLTSEERKSIQKSAVLWADKHLPKVTMPDGTIGARLTIQTKEGVELHIGKKFFTETYSKCKNSKRVAETMELATRINEWIKDAEQIRVEPGRHHAFDFVVFKAVYNNQEIEFKAKSTEGLIVYMMRLL